MENPVCLRQAGGLMKKIRSDKKLRRKIRKIECVKNEDQVMLSIALKGKVDIFVAGDNELLDL